MKLVQVTPRLTGRVVNTLSGRFVSVATKQRVSGGGDKNLMSWAINIKEAGYDGMEVRVLNDAPHAVKTSIAKRAQMAQRILNFPVNIKIVSK